MSSAQPSERPQPSLKAAYRAAERLREALEQGRAVPGGNGGSGGSGGGTQTYGDVVRAALDAYETCGRRAAALALFSPNESADDIATAHLPYLLVPLRVAELAQRLPTTTAPPLSPGSDSSPIAARRAVLRRARDAYEQFLHSLDGYGLLPAPYARLLAAYTEDPAHFSTVGDGGGGRGAGGGGAGGLADPAARRNAKIANLRAEKELRNQLEVLRQRQAERRERRRRQRQRLRENDGDAPESDDGDDDDDDDDDDEDEEEARKLYRAQLAYSAHMAFQGLEGLNLEDELLARAPPAGSGSGSGGRGRMGGLGDGGDGRQRDTDAAGGGAGRADRLDTPGSTGPGMRRLQSALAGTPLWAGAGTGAGAAAGPLLTAEGRPRQPFTIVGNRAELAQSVFRPGHNLPTMSIDDYLEEERRRGGIIEGGGPSSGRQPEPDEDNEALADAATMKARAWDEFVEANPRGAGNTLNRG